MNRNLILLSAVTASLLTSSAAFAQAPAAAAPTAAATAAPAPAPAPAPQAIPAKIALVNFEQVVLASNEGQTVAAATQKKYDPRRAQLETLQGEIETLKKNLQALPATTPDEERTSRLRAIDTKEKQLNRDAEDAQTAYQTELQESLGKVAGKLNVVMQNYVQANGFTLLLDVSQQNSNVLWAVQSTNVSQAIVDAYNKQSGVAAPPPPSPRPATAPRPGTTPRPGTAPRR